jgi:peptide/nickel transport system substrate-binding protein
MNILAKKKPIVFHHWLRLGLLLCLCFSACQSGKSPDQTVTPTVQPSATPDATAALMPFAPQKYVAPGCSYGGEIKSIEAVAEYSLKFTLCYPDVAFLTKIASTALGIQPSEWLEKNKGQGDLLEKPVGTGPYRLLEWKPGQQLSFQRFEDYWGEKAKTPSLIFSWDPDASQRLEALRNGEADAINGLSAEDYPVLLTDPSLVIKPRSNLDILYLGMNNTIPPFDNEKVRQALSLAVDRKSIVEKYFPLSPTPADYFTPCEITYGCAGNEPWGNYDPERAKAVLKEAGFPDGFTTDLYYRDVVRPYLSQPVKIAEMIRDQLKANLNITVNLIKFDTDVFLAAADAGELKGLFLFGLTANYPDPSYLLDFHFGWAATKQFGNKYEDIAKALKDANTFFEAQRQQYYGEANKLIKAHVPAIPIAHSGAQVAFLSSVSNPQTSPVNQERFADMSNGKDTFVWIEESEPYSLYCADETDASAQRACAQITETLYRHDPVFEFVQPGLAEWCTPTANYTEWNCLLKSNVRFHDGTQLDANDVVVSIGLQWIAAHELHKGRTGEFIPFESMFGAFLPEMPK